MTLATILWRTIAPQIGLACHRGPLDDVSARFIQAAQAQRADAFIRITGDSPLMDPAIIDQAAGLYRGGDWDLVTNVLERSFPIGQSVEALRLSTFQAVQAKFTDPAQREHVTQYYYCNPGQFRIQGFTSGSRRQSRCSFPWTHRKISSPRRRLSLEAAVIPAAGTNWLR